MLQVLSQHVVCVYIVQKFAYFYTIYLTSYPLLLQSATFIIC